MKLAKPGKGEVVAVTAKCGLQVFISGEPDHWCRVPEVLARGNLTLSQVKRLTIPRVDLGEKHKDIVIYQGGGRCSQATCRILLLFSF